VNIYYKNWRKIKKKKLNETLNKEVEIEKVNYEKACQKWKNAQDEYDKLIEDVKLQYGQINIEKADLFVNALNILSKESDNIGLCFRQILYGITIARDAFSSNNFKEFVDAIAEKYRQEALLKISHGFSVLPLIAFHLLQQPINALIANDFNKLMIEDVKNNNNQQGYIVEEPNDDHKQK